MRRRIEIKEEKYSGSLLTLLQEMGEFLPAYCGGKGVCGKCKVRIRKKDGGQPEITVTDRAFFTEEELKDGWRLACCVTAEQGMLVELAGESDEEEMEIAVDFRLGVESEAASLPADREREESDTETVVSAMKQKEGTCPGESEDDREYVMVVDIGTTTIAASLVDLSAGQILKTVTGVNHQRRYGADVVSRMQASNEGKGSELQRSIEEDLAGLAERLGVDYDRIPIIISGNTTMEHLLQNLSCRTLGKAPYDPVDISLHDYKNMTILPGISTFVGADIVSGIIACGMDQSEEISLLIDLGTNGEMAIGNKDRILVTSTAAGPAFEGGNICHGVAGIPGAISSVEIEDSKIPGGDAAVHVQTIGDKEAIGLCGTGVIEAVYEMLKQEWIDMTGRMEAPYDKEGFRLSGQIALYQKDVREIQLAKSAICAGAETLISEYGIKPRKVDKVYLAGGFGQKINVDKALGIGLLPRIKPERIRAVGNSSLAGAILYATDPSVRARYLKVAAESTEIALATNKKFNNLYIERMLFE